MLNIIFDNRANLYVSKAMMQYTGLLDILNYDAYMMYFHIATPCLLSTLAMEE